MTTMPSIFEPFVRVKQRSEAGAGYYAFLHRCSHRAFVNGSSAEDARAALAEHCARHEASIRRSMIVLGLLPA